MMSEELMGNATRQSAEVEDDHSIPGLGRVWGLSRLFFRSLRRFSRRAAPSFPSLPRYKVSIDLSAYALLTMCALIASSAISGCSKTCTDNSACGEGEVCVVANKSCAKRCTSSTDCSGELLCLTVQSGVSACVTRGNTPEPSGVQSEDQSLGNQCVSPRDDGTSTPTDQLGACGDNAPTCNTAFGTGASGLNPQTCTVECANDEFCGEQVPPRCLGDCAAAYANLCCIPRLSPALQVGQKKDSANQTLKTYCRPRLLCYFVSKRCEGNGPCPGPRAGNCKPTADGGGECSQGTRDLYECCMRNGECDATKDLLCMPSLNNGAGYCSRNCSTDNDCKASGSPTASCWTTTLKAVPGKPGKCEVVAATGSEAFCRNKAKPCAKNSPVGQCNVTPTPAAEADLVDCALDDVPLSLPDNSYDATTKRCVYR